MLKKIRRSRRLFGFFGFFGCFGFEYFTSRDVGDLFYFSFFAFFAFFLIGSITGQKSDEMLVENSRRAAHNTFFIPMFAIFLIGYSASMPFGTKEFVVIVSALAWAASFLTYAILLYHYEKH